MAGNLDFLPGRQLGVDGAQLLVGLVGEPGDFVGDVDLAGRLHAPQFLDFAFEFGHGFFEFQELTHGTRRLAHIAGVGSLALLLPFLLPGRGAEIDLLRRGIHKD